MSNATKKYPTRARISLDLFTSIFLSPKTVLATEEATCKYPRGRGREVGQGGEEGHRDGGGRAKDRKRGRREEWRREGREGSIRSRSHVTAGSPWCFPDTTRGFRTRHWFQKGTREQRKSRVSVCAKHTFQNYGKVPDSGRAGTSGEGGARMRFALEYHLFR